LGLSVRVGKSVFNHYLELDPWQRNLGLAGFLTVGPFLWLYGKALIEKSFRLSQRDYGHFIPAILYALLSPIIPNESNLPSYISYSLVLGQLLTYCLISYRYAQSQSVLPDQSLYQWYWNIVLGVAATWLLYLLIFLGIVPFYMVGAIVYSALIYLFSYQLLRRHQFAHRKYQNSTLSEKQAQQTLLALEQLFTQEKLYLKNDLTVAEVAQRLDVTPRHLSQAINERKGQNFSELVNTFRIQEARQLLEDPTMADQKIAAIAFDAGFNNLTSFNAAFKDHTQCTPSQYRKRFLAS
ncbi:MAG: helix-turn-helix domain-containing protein, partial [Bacteroidota bacterium]